MPLINGRSRNVIGANIRMLIEEGYPRNQAIAISYEKAGIKTRSGGTTPIHSYRKKTVNPFRALEEEIMKQLFLFGVITLLLIGNVFALTDMEAVSLAGSCLPGDACYGLEKLFDNIKVALTSNKVEKASTLIDQSQERLAEAMIVSIQGKDSLAQQALDDETDRVSRADDIVANQLSTKEIADNVLRLEDLKNKLSNRDKALGDVISKIQSDNNPNNDHALPALQAALVRTQKIRGDLDNANTRTDQNLKAQGYPGIEDIKRAMIASKVNGIPVSIDNNGQLVVASNPGKGRNY